MYTIPTETLKELKFAEVEKGLKTVFPKVTFTDKNFRRYLQGAVKTGQINMEVSVSFVIPKP